MPWWPLSTCQAASCERARSSSLAHADGHVDRVGQRGARGLRAARKRWPSRARSRCTSPGSSRTASLAEVGRAFGKDHTTVLHAVDKIQTLLQADPNFKKTFDTLTRGLTT
jgi:hypothetical protein